MAEYDQRGKFGGLCAVPDCPNRSRWVPISRAKHDPNTYYCTEHCDEISARFNAEYERLTHEIAYASGMRSQSATLPNNQDAIDVLTALIERLTAERQALD